MKKTTLSLIAVMAMASSLAAAEVEKKESMVSGIENITVSGDAKLYYSTDDTKIGTEKPDLFSQESAKGQVGFNIGVSADLSENVSGKINLQGISTLGLENNLVNNVWSGGTTQTEVWASEAWVAGTLGKTTAKIGRMELDTPLVFTENWSVSSNTFESGILLNEDIPDTTIVAGYIGRHNGGANGSIGIVDPVKNDTFSSFGNGAYVIGGINNSWEPLTAQAWYYNVTDASKAYWLQADLDIEGIKVGAQYGANMLNDDTLDADGNAFAVKVGYTNKDLMDLKLCGSYSQTGDKSAFGSNFSTGGQSKLYTEMYYNFGNVTAKDTSSFKVHGSIVVPGEVGLMAQYVQADMDKYDNTASEVTLEASKKFGGLNTSIAYMSVKDLANSSYTGSTTTENIVQAKLNYSF